MKYKILDLSVGKVLEISFYEKDIVELAINRIYYSEILNSYSIQCYNQLYSLPLDAKLLPSSWFEIVEIPN